MAGSHAFVSYRERDLLPEDERRIAQYQKGAFSRDLAVYRNGGRESLPLRLFRTLVDTQSDARNYVVYRGLGANDFLAEGDQWQEPTVSSWSLFPHKALWTALAGQRSRQLILLRDRILPGEPSLYIDDWEEEVVRGLVARKVETCYQSEYLLFGESHLVQVADLGVA